MREAVALKHNYLFSRLAEERLAEVEASLETRYLQAGEVLFNMGDPGDELFIVESGRVAIYAPDDKNPGQEQPIRIFRTGGVLGEMALIDRQPRSLSARALEPSAVYVLSGNTFRQLIREDPDMAYAVMYGLSDRIRYTTEFLNEVRQWVGRVTQGDYGSHQFLDEVRHWVKQVAEGEYHETVERNGKYQDQTLATLAAEFAQMAARVQERENELRQEIAQLRIEIDETKRKQEVSEITGSDYFKSLKEQIKSMRDQQSEE
ncbi:MAG: cyclic nucleotide-binding domain-containing protein [Chloroflexi bacterium]|nr:cyclic nucleotide-binding domain-containing protein [Chloroflexota bacterium]MCI0578108.1 cyclic nucleotide-binding domain-containing protein [Chloroflexota bacterium]MCI0644412.1 cyclic nucleotide-binding domain-containing protein [Chloroflexota bacterium]MCI0727922.1 cyclic nucleotide-binding domain-containing protein [Chloroflexota bacterium]